MKLVMARGVWMLLRDSFYAWLDDNVQRLGAALAYYTVFSLAPLLIIAIAIAGLAFGQEAAQGQIMSQIEGLLGEQGAKATQTMIESARQPTAGLVASLLGIIMLVFGATGAFAQLQDALNTIWGVKAKPGEGIMSFLRARFVSFAMLGGVFFLLLVSLTVEALLKGFSHYVQAHLPGGLAIAVSVYLVFDFAVVVLLFAMIFKFLPDAEVQWRDVWIGAIMTAIFFGIGKWALGLYLGSGSAASAYGAASSLITLLLWIYYSSQILLFGAEFTQVYANWAGRRVAPSEHAVPIVTREVEQPHPKKG